MSESNANLVSAAPDEGDDDEDDPAEDVADVAEDVSEVLQTDGGDLAEVVVVAEVEVAGGVGGGLVLGDHLQHRQRVEYPRQEDYPRVQRGLDRSFHVLHLYTG